ncbi:GntR family transcriptional regulator [Rhodobacter sp. 140A]|uniref:Putative L-lactate dehydrogenase operon regulatory protein n=1 Tax=bioreactor metagenome TaxID=1076179 RepID=A0A644WXZ3_9ZZZZ|nr:GntR family transcriptional regulator [Rhodobacter sp. 140A]
MPDLTAPSEDNSMLARLELLAMIRSGTLGPEGRLPPERELCARWGIGRRALRRALESLEVEGILWRRQGKGTFAGQAADRVGRIAAGIVGQIAPLEMMFARLQIEPALAAEAARRADPEDIKRLRDLAARVERSRDHDSTELWDWSLHRYIARMSGNRALLVSLAMMNEMRIDSVWREQREGARTSATLRVTHQQHGAIIDAIAAGDPIAAEAAMRLHLRTIMRNLELFLERDNGKETVE